MTNKPTDQATNRPTDQSTNRLTDLSLRHLQIELARIDVLIRREARRWQLANQQPADSFRGFYVSHEDAQALLKRAFGVSWGQSVTLPPDEARQFAEAQAKVQEQAQEFVKLAHSKGLSLRLIHLAAVFGLDRFEVDTLLICLAPTLDLRYEQLYGYLQDHVARKRPSVNLILNLLAEPGPKRFAPMAHFGDEAPLFKRQILRCIVEPGQVEPPLLSQTLVVDQTVVAWLWGDYQPRPDFGPHVTLLSPRREDFDPLLTPDIRQNLAAIEGEPVVVFYGPDRGGQETAAKFIAAHRKRPLLLVDLTAITGDQFSPLQTLRLVLRDARLTGAIPCLMGWDPYLDDNRTPPHLLAELCDYPELVIVAGEANWQAGGLARIRSLFRQEFAIPDYAHRRTLWRYFLNGDVAGLVGRAAAVSVAGLIECDAAGSPAGSTERDEASPVAGLTERDEAGPVAGSAKHAVGPVAGLTERDEVVPAAGSTEHDEAGPAAGSAKHAAGPVAGSTERDEVVPVAGSTERDEAGPVAGSAKHAAGPVTLPDTTQLADQFYLTTDQIRDAVTTARDMTRQQGAAMSLDNLFIAARTHSITRLSTLAQKISPRYDWDDIILPDDQVTLLQEIVNTVRGRSTVLEAWQIGKKLASSQGVTILFGGPPGTGKTMAAEVIARNLGFDLYKIDLSTIVSKYIGETEKNLERIFTEAERSNAILFFDEADSLFGKRSEVRDSHDRYANIEISYLLQRMEAYNGVTILATNLRANLDEAFTRRLHFAVSFPFPDEEDRRRIWQTLFPDTVPRHADLDLDLMARRFKLAGGNIRNIIVSAAYLAAGDGGALTMAHLMHSTARELQKMGRLIKTTDFELGN